MLEHVVMLPGAAPNGDVPDVIGLTPGVESSVAPMGIPVRGTAGAGPIPSGDVIPSGDPDGPIAPICADAEPLASKAAVNIASDQPPNLSERAICNLHFFRGVGIARTAAQCRRTSALRPPGHPRRVRRGTLAGNRTAESDFKHHAERDLSAIAAI
jgi:hypothetical protein